MTRKGKIARLPNDIREQINSRLQDGEEGKSILSWLNSLPKVQTILADLFDGRPVNHANLSDWKLGGYRDWLLQQDVRQFARDLQDETPLGTRIWAEHRAPTSSTGQLSNTPLLPKPSLLTNSIQKQSGLASVNSARMSPSSTVRN